MYSSLDDSGSPVRSPSSPERLLSHTLGIHLLTLFIVSVLGTAKAFVLPQFIQVLPLNTQNEYVISELCSSSSTSILDSLYELIRSSSIERPSYGLNGVPEKDLINFQCVGRGSAGSVITDPQVRDTV